MIGGHTVASERVGDDHRIGPAGQLDARKRARHPEELGERALERALPRATRQDQRAVDVEEDEPRNGQTDSPRTLPALGPFAEGSSSKFTRCPSFSWSKDPSRTELRWKNHSCPPSSLINPNPLSRTRRLIVPLGIESPSGRGGLQARI
jgi:hypothetical protein